MAAVHRALPLLHLCLYHVATSALLPFITLFYLEWGLSYAETGLVSGVRTLLLAPSLLVWTALLRRIHSTASVRLLITVALILVAANYFSLLLPEPVTPTKCHANQSAAGERARRALLAPPPAPPESPLTPPASPLTPPASPLTPPVSPLTPPVSPLTPPESPLAPPAPPVTPPASPLAPVRRDERSGGLSQTFWYILLTMSLGAIVNPPIKKTIDDLLADYWDKFEATSNRKYPKICGFIFSMVTVAGVGFLVSFAPCVSVLYPSQYTGAFIIMAVMMLCSAALTPWFPVAEERQEKFRIVKSLRGVWADLTWRMCLYAACLLCVELAQAPLSLFLPWKLRLLQAGTDWLWGLTVAGSLAAELAVYQWRARYEETALKFRTVALCLVLQGAKMLYYSYLSWGWTVVLVEFSHAITRSLMSLAIYSYIAHITPSWDVRDVSFAIQACFGSLGNGLGSILSGLLASHWSLDTMFRIMSIVEVVVFLLLLGLYLVVRNRHDRMRREKQQNNGATESNTLENEKT